MTESQVGSQPPIAKRVEHRREHHGDVFVDQYEWLREKTNPDVISYLEAENVYTEEQTAVLEPLRQRIFDEIKARTKETDLSVPTRRGDWWYYGRSFEGKQYGVQCRCPVADPDDWTPPVLDEDTEVPGEQVLLDENVEAEGHDFFSLGAASVTLDGHTLAYSVDVKGDERYTLRFRDLRTGQTYDDVIEGIGAGATWAADNRTVYYVTVDEAWRPDTVWRHRLGAGQPGEKVHHEPDERFWIGVGRSRSDKYLFIAAGSSITTEMLYADATDPEATFTSILPRREGVEYSVEHAVVGGEDRFLILHNDGAENFTLVEAPVSDPTAFRTLIEHRDDVRLDGVDAFATQLVVSYRSEALPRIQLWPISAEGGYGQAEDITFDTELTSSGLAGNPNWSAPRLRVATTSFVVPLRIYDIDLATGERILLREQPVLGDYRPQEYVERRDWAVAEDGARVPVSIIHRAGVQFPAPALIYGYGAYESCEDPRFSIVRAGQAAEQEEHVHRLHRRRTASRRHRRHAGGESGGTRRKRRRSADGRGGEHGTGRVRGHPGAGPVRRRAHHDSGSVAAPYGHGVGRVGQPARRRGRLRVHEVLLAVRERRAQELSGDPGDDLAQRHSGLLRRTGQVGCRAAACERRLRAAEDGDVGGPRRH
ncbi:MAG: oligopeptidase Serine peptidase family, partial [Mycobacterium sp.]|nr:oligopeptidase Serine peptidase family [Mycobacterium sp.]